MRTHRRLRALLLVVGGLATVWAAGLALYGGLVIKLGGWTLSSRAPRNPLILAIIAAVAALVPWTAEELRHTRQRLVRWNDVFFTTHALQWLDSTRAWGLVSIGLTMLGTVWIMRLPNIGGDTGLFMQGTDGIVSCIREVHFFQCGTFAGGTDTYIAPYPLFHYLPDLAFITAGLDHESRPLALSLLSIAAFVAMLVVAGRTLARIERHVWWPAFLVIVLTSPLLYYAYATWGEMLATFLILVFTASALVSSRPLMVASTALAAAITKETAFPFLFLLGSGSLLLARRRTGRPVARQFVGMIAGLITATGLSALFNLFRFGSPFNEFYLQPKFHVGALSEQAEFFAGLLVAPNVGLAFFWTSACLLLGIAMVLPIVLRLRGMRVAVWPSLWLMAFAAALSSMLATWWSPFGWYAWGPRLSLPWVPSLVLVAIAAYGHLAEPVVARVLQSNARLFGLSACLLLLTLPHIGYVLRHEEIDAAFFAFDEHCSPDVTLQTLATPEGWRSYFACTRYRAWGHPSVLVGASLKVASVPGVAWSVVWLFVVTALLHLMRMTGRQEFAQTQSAFRIEH